MAIALASYLVPKNGNTWYILEDVFVKGGLQVVANVIARDSLNPGNLKPGMLVVTQDTRKLWQLDANAITWTEFSMGSGGAPALGGTVIPNCSLDPSTPNQRLEFMATNPLSWNTGQGKMSVDYSFVSNGFFLNNPGARINTVLRQDPATTGTALSGHGVVMGNLIGSGSGSDSALYTPTMMLETWDPLRATTHRQLFGSSAGPRNKVLLDGQMYRVLIDSTVHFSGIRYVRYRLYRYTGVSLNAWDLETDSGDVLDHNAGANFTKSGFLLSAGLLDNLDMWDISFSNIRVTWGPSADLASDVTSKLSRHGAELDGDLVFASTGKRLKFPSNASTNLTNSLTLQSSTADTGTTLTLKPNGTSTISNTLYSNNAYSTTTYQYLSVGMSGGRGQLKTGNIGGASVVPLDVVLGTSTVATFSATGIRLLNGTTDIGVGISYGAGLSNFGGTNAVSYSTTATLNLESVCTVGGLSTSLGATPSGATVEAALRPLYCMFSELVADLKRKKIL